MPWYRALQSGIDSTYDLESRSISIHWAEEGSVVQGALNLLIRACDGVNCLPRVEKLNGSLALRSEYLQLSLKVERYARHVAPPV
jgi:hypothetical protein